jgi:hypothetical protein
VAGVSMFLLTDRTVGAYLYGVEPRLRALVDITVMNARAGLELATQVGAQRLNLLRGAEESKLRWQPRELRNQQMVLLRPEIGRGHAVAVHRLASWAGSNWAKAGEIMRC